MEKDRMYITINRNREWNRSLLVNLLAKDNQVVFDLSKENEYGMLAAGILITGSIDSTEHDFQWDSMLIDADMPENSVIKISCFASDSKEILLGYRLVNLDEYIKDSQKDAKNKLIELSKLFKPSFSGSTDGLIRVRGRYLWIKLEFLVPQPQKFCLRKIKVLLANEKIIQYLPEIYRDSNEDNNFFERFMAIFDSIFFNIEERIEKMSDELDYTIAKSEMLRYLASWLCIQDTHGMDDESLRERIASIIPEYSAIGTKPGIEKFVESELGVTPTIIEYFNYEQMLRESKDKEIFKELFGTNTYKFFILLPEEVFTKNRNINGFLKKLKNNIPAYTEVELIKLKKGTILGKHTYLGVNSMVGEYNYVSVDENKSISYDTLIGGDENEK